LDYLEVVLVFDLYLNQRRDWRHGESRASLDDFEEESHEPLTNAGEQLDMSQALARM
jgi:hypothetical protein